MKGPTVKILNLNEHPEVRALIKKQRKRRDPAKKQEVKTK